MDVNQITDDEFIKQFKPIQNHLIGEDAPWGGIMFETYGDELKHVCLIANLYPDHVWTLSECDEGMVISNGYSFVNRFGYFITELPAPQNVWTIATDPEDHEFIDD